MALWYSEGKADCWSRQAAANRWIPELQGHLGDGAPEARLVVAARDQTLISHRLVGLY